MGYTRIAQIAAPLILINATQVVMQLTDRKFLSMLSPAHLGAALPGGVLAFTLGAFFLVTTAFATPMIAQNFGRHNLEACAKIPWTAAWFGLGAGLICSWLVLPIGSMVINFFDHNQPHIAGLELDYYLTLLPGIGFSCIMMAFTAFFSGRGITWVPSLIQLMVCALNIFLDWVLIFGKFGFPALEMAGAGFGTTLSQVFGMTITFLFFLFFAKQTHYPTRKFRFPDWGVLKTMIRFGSASGFNVFSDVGAFTVVVFLIGQLGEEAKVTCAIALSINMVAFAPLLGLSESVCILVGQFIGRKRLGQAQGIVYRALHIAFIYMCCTGTLFIIFGTDLINWFAPNSNLNDFSAILNDGRRVLICVAFFSFFDAVVFVTGGAMRGAGDTTVPMLILSSAHWLLWVPMTAILVHFNFNMLAVWIYLILHMAFVSTLLFMRFRSGAWRKIKVIRPEPPLIPGEMIP